MENTAQKTMSKRWHLNMNDAEPILKAFVYSTASTALGTAILLLPMFDVPVKWLWIIPMINMVLVTAKKTLDGKK